MQLGKRIIPILTGTALLALLAVGCEEESTEPEIHELVGTWGATSVTFYYGASVESPDSSEVHPVDSEVLTFNEDNTGIVSHSAEDETETTDFTWSASGSDLTVTFEENGTTISSTVTYAVSGNTLTITGHSEADPDFDEPETWFVSVYQKQ